MDHISTDESPAALGAHDGQPTTHREGAAMDISNAMVRLYKDQFGRGPTKARTYWCGSDVITVTLEDTLTPAERNLVKLGEHQRLRDLRLFFQYASVREFCAPVEEATGRTVRAFFSAIDTHIDGMSIETFVLYPKGAEGPSRIELVESSDGAGPTSQPG